MSIERREIWEAKIASAEPSLRSRARQTEVWVTRLDMILWAAQALTWSTIDSGRVAGGYYRKRARESKKDGECNWRSESVSDAETMASWPVLDSLRDGCEDKASWEFAMVFPLAQRTQGNLFRISGLYSLCIQRCWQNQMKDALSLEFDWNLF